jgi:sRNA-binding carbon storage regulator CsrA
MLGLSRMERESITVTHDGEELKFIVGSIKGRRVRLFIDAPKSFRVRRTELDVIEDQTENGIPLNTRMKTNGSSKEATSGQ